MSLGPQSAPPPPRIEELDKPYINNAASRLPPTCAEQYGTLPRRKRVAKKRKGREVN